MSQTIAAIATAMGAGGIAIVRISGENALPVLKQVFFPARKKRSFEPSRMMYGLVKDEKGETVDEAMAVYFPAGIASNGTLGSTASALKLMVDMMFILYIKPAPVSAGGC